MVALCLSKKRETHEEFVKGVGILATIDPNELVNIVDVAKIVEFPAGQQIITQVIKEELKVGCRR